MFETRITKMLGIKYPIIQGGMQWLARAELAAAVSNAGGLGIVAAGTFPTKEELRDEIRKAKKLTDKPFGVNISLFPAIRPPDIDGYIDVLGEEGISVVETAGRNPEPYMAHFKQKNIKVIHKVTAVRFALKAQQAGCDAVIIDGCECAGHPGEDDVSSLILVPLTADALEVPVIAAGGFGDGRGLVAALALGAEGILMGTRFMLSQEAPMHPAVKEHLVKNVNETDTMFIMRSFKNTARVIKNQVAQKVAAMEAQGASIEEVIPLVAGRRGLELYERGDINAGIVACGMVAGLIKEVPTVQEIIDKMIADGVKVKAKLAEAK